MNAHGGIGLQQARETGPSHNVSSMEPTGGAWNGFSSN